MDPRGVFALAKKNNVQAVDLKFIDLIGTWQHFTIPIEEELNEGTFKDGSGLDGSSIRWKAINNSDRLAIPDPATACLDPLRRCRR